MRASSIQIGEHRHRLDFKELTGGKVITVYGQQEVVKDLIARRHADGSASCSRPRMRRSMISTEKAAHHLHRAEGERRDRLRLHRRLRRLSWHLPAIRPEGAITIYDRVYPFAWLGILAEAEPASEEVIYVNHQRGFALLHMRSHEVARLYLQCRPDEDLAEWPDARIWEELHARLRTADGDTVTRGRSSEGRHRMRSFVAEPMRHGRLFLAGDAAHIVPPTGAKGMNLAVADVRVLALALAAFYREKRKDLLDDIPTPASTRVWRAEHFSWFMTSMLHSFPTRTASASACSARSSIMSSRRARPAQSLAENYVGHALCRMRHSRIRAVWRRAGKRSAPRSWNGETTTTIQVR